MEDILNTLMSTDLVDAGIGALAMVLAFLIAKLPPKIKAAVTALFDKTDKELEKDAANDSDSSS